MIGLLIMSAKSFITVISPLDGKIAFSLVLAAVSSHILLNMTLIKKEGKRIMLPFYSF